MNHEVLYAPDNTLVKIVFKKGESIRAESDAMVGMSDGITLKTGFGAGKNSGGIFKNILRGLLTSESFFTNVFTATADDQEILLAPGLEGDIEWVELNNNALIIQAGSYLGGSSELTVDTQFQGLKSFFSGESMFMLKVSGQGSVIINSFGGIEKIEVNDYYIVDTGHIVAFTDGLNYKIGKAAAGWVDSFLSGEGLVCEFTGKGTVYIQSRNPVEYGRFVGGLLKPIIKNE
jgi:uncharacterized protein (TIGR00266 family)